MNSEVCNSDIYKNGKHIITLSSNTKLIVNQLCEIMNEQACNKCFFDWHYIGGRAVVKYIGDYSTARQILINNLPWYNSQLNSDFAIKYPGISEIKYTEANIKNIE